jgi:hypothetical protein
VFTQNSLLRPVAQSFRLFGGIKNIKKTIYKHKGVVSFVLDNVLVNPVKVDKMSFENIFK